MNKQIKTTLKSFLTGDFICVIFWTAVLLAVCESDACPEWKVLYILISAIGFQLSMHFWNTPRIKGEVSAKTV